MITNDRVDALILERRQLLENLLPLRNTLESKDFLRQLAEFGGADGHLKLLKLGLNIFTSMIVATELGSVSLQPQPDPIPDTSLMAREIRDTLIAGRNNALESDVFDPSLAVGLSHMVRALNTGVIVQVKPYDPSTD